MKEEKRHPKSAQMIVVTNGTKGNVVCDTGLLANTFWTRLRGLLGRKHLEPGEGLLIQPSSGVHTFGMSFPIDIVTLDKGRQVVGLYESIGSSRVRGLSIKTRGVLELPAGQIQACGIEQGDQLCVHSAEAFQERLWRDSWTATRA